YYQPNPHAVIGALLARAAWARSSAGMAMKRLTLAIAALLWLRPPRSGYLFFAPRPSCVARWWERLITQVEYDFGEPRDMKATLSAVIAVLAISTATHAADGRDKTCRGILREVENTGGDNVKIGPCQFTIDQYAGVDITNKCRFGQPCTVHARVVRDGR